MKRHAVIFDIYGTLLEVGPPIDDPELGWQQLFYDYFRIPPPLTLAEFATACGKVIVHRHDDARSRGIPFPEILWPSIVCEVLPKLSALDSQSHNEFIFRERQLAHSTCLNRQAAALLRQLSEGGYVLGIASNAQAYTVIEFDQACAAAGLDSNALFQPDLCFWSFRHGFSKPDPHVFQILTTRLQARGVAAEEILMIGDRLDNDIEPALAHGWQTWWLTANPQPHAGGNWHVLTEKLAIPLP